MRKNFVNFTLKQRFNYVFTFTERFRGTFLEKWAMYWKNLITDYKDVAAGVIKEAKEKPKKTIYYTLATYTLYECAIRNPDSECFQRQFRMAVNDMILVSPSLQNPIANEYLKQLENDINQNRLRFMSLGFFTILWEDLYDADDCTYPAICEYTKVSYWNIHKHIIDIGFWNQFWHLKWKVRNYDVNYL